MRSFLHWWFEQLASLIPTPLRQFRFSSRNAPTITIEGHSLTIPGQKAGEKTTIPFDRRSGDSPEVSQTLEERLPSKPNALRVRLAPQEFLVQRLTLPASARNHLREAIGYQLSKLTPFNPDQVIYACGMQDNGAQDGQQNAWLVVVPRQKITTALDILGLSPPNGSIDIDRPPEPSEWLEFVWRFSSTSGGSRRTRQILWGGAFLVLGLAAGLHLYQKVETHRAYASKVEALDGQMEEVKRLQRIISATTAPFEHLNDLRSARISTLEVLQSLTQEIGDDTWLDYFELKGDKLKIQGFSPNPAGLIQLLESLPTMSEVRFESAITQDPRRNLSRFSIGARIAAQQEPET